MLPPKPALGRFPKLLLSTDRAVVPGADLLGALRRVLEHVPRGSVWVELCGHGLSGADFLAETTALMEMAEACGARVLIQDRLDIAMATGAAGLTISARGFSVMEVRQAWSVGGPGLLLGVECHSDAEISRAARFGADFAILAPVFPSKSARFSSGSPLGEAIVARARQAAPALPIFAMGGITHDCAPRMMAHGASGVGVCHDILADLDPAAAASVLLRSIGTRVSDPCQLDSALPLDENR